MQGFLNLYKPAGWTSHDCVARVRQLLKIKRVGHGGTLDPAAVGVLPIAFGQATRLLQFLPQEKTYQATIRLGITTTTDDLEGEIITEVSAPDLSLGKIQAILPDFQGTLEQVPPRYSAIQIGGKRLYQMARQKREFEVPVRTIIVHHIDLLDWRSGDQPEVDLLITCGPGTYIRAIARDLGQALGVGGTLSTLTRTHSCGFNLKESLTLADLEAQLQTGDFQPLDPGMVLNHLTGVSLTDQTANRWLHGQQVPCSEVTNGDLAVPLRVYQSKTQAFLGIGCLVEAGDRRLLIPKVVLA